MEGDAWVISFLEAENRLLIGGCRRKCLSILKTLRDQVWMDYTSKDSTLNANSSKPTGAISDRGAFEKS